MDPIACLAGTFNLFILPVRHYIVTWWSDSLTNPVSRTSRQARDYDLDQRHIDRTNLADGAISRNIFQRAVEVS